MLGTSRLDTNPTRLTGKFRFRHWIAAFAAIHIHGVPSDEAIFANSKGFARQKNRSMRWNVAGIPLIDPQQVIWLDFANVTVRRLLQALTDQLQSGPAVDFDVHDDTICHRDHMHASALPAAAHLQHR